MTLREWIDENLDEVLLADGFDDAVLGYGYTPGIGERLVYDAAKCIQILVAQGMDEEEAEEYFQFNTEGAYMGKQTPVFMWRINLEDED